MLIGKWTPKMLALFSVLAEEWRSWQYGMDLSEKPVKVRYTSPYYTFYGTGRWTFDNNLADIGVHILHTSKEIVHNAMFELAKLMHKNRSYMSVDFVDREGGLGILYQSIFLIVPVQRDDGKFILTGKEERKEYYDFTPTNQRRLGYEDVIPDESNEGYDDDDEEITSKTKNNNDKGKKSADDRMDELNAESDKVYQEAMKVYHMMRAD